MQRGREAPVVVELLGLQLVHREDDRKAAPPEVPERADERDVAEDAGLVLDEDRLDVVAYVLQLLEEVLGVEVAYADERHAVAARAQSVAHRERVVVDAAALIAREHDHAAPALCRELEVAQREGRREAFADLGAREVLEPSLAALDEVLARALIANDTLERIGDGVG